MATTSVKLPEELRSRATAAAQARGLSTHAFLVEAIRQSVDATERRARFIDDAMAARDHTLTSDQAVDANDVHAYLRDKSAGKPVRRPGARSWRE